jgi:ABC-type nitrate/sulfonate/bicarbonate transport system permease component
MSLQGIKSAAVADTVEDSSFARPSVRQSWLQRHASTLRSAISIFGVAVLWEVVARFVVANALFLVPLSDIWAETVRLAQSGRLAAYSWVSLQEFLAGFALAVIVGVSIGLAMAVSRPVHDVFDPWISGFQSTPLIALGPLFVLWFGLGINSKIAVVFVVAIFPIIINTHAGIRSTPAHLIEAARSFGARRAQVYREVMLPAALPVMAAGLRLGVARGLLGVVVGEIFSSNAGLGFLIVNSSQTYNTAGLFTGVLMFAIAGVVSTRLLLALENRLAPWRTVNADD